MWIRMCPYLHHLCRDAAAEASPARGTHRPPVLPAADIEALRDWSFFYDWDSHHQQVRWMTAWDTELADIDQFVAGVRHFVG